MFDDLAQPAAHLAHGQRCKKAGIGKHISTLAERAHQIFDAAEVNGGLAAHRRVHLREQRGGHLDAVDPAHVERGSQSAHIPHNAPAQTDKAVAAMQPRRRHGGKQRKERFRRLVLLAGRHGMHADRSERLARAGAVQFPDPLV